MLSNVKIELEVVLNGGAAIQEHPAPREDTSFASVWRTKLQNLFCAGAPGFQRLTIHQWKFGATAVKPTTLRRMGRPPSARVLHGQALVDVVKPISALAGLDECGKFRAKEYPEGLCRALAVTLLQRLAQRRHKEGLAVRLASQLEERAIVWLGSVATSSATSFSSHFISTISLRAECTDLQDSTELCFISCGMK